MRQEMCNTLFPPKELYLAEHNSNGHSRKLEIIPKYQRRKRVYNNMHLMEGMIFTDKNGFPQLAPYTGPIDFEAIPYTERKKHNGVNQALHFFLDDYRFRDAVWCSLERTTYEISKYEICFTPDLSLWRDLPTDFYNRQNVFRTRFIGAYWQQCGFTVIPTASWGDLNSFSYCFDGLPKNSVIAVSGMGNKRNPDAFNRWCYGLKRLEDSTHPSLILVYGAETKVPNLHTPIQFMPDFISTKLRAL